MQGSLWEMEKKMKPKETRHEKKGGLREQRKSRQQKCYRLPGKRITDGQYLFGLP